MPQIDVTDRAQIHAEVQHFYARQIRLLDADVHRGRPDAPRLAR